MNDKLNLEVTIKPALTVERIREELADMVGLPINDETRAEMVRRLNAIGLFDFSVKAEPVHDSDCSTNNRGVPELMGPCDCSLSQAKQHVADLPILSEEGYRQLAELLKNPPEFNERLKEAIEKSRSGEFTIKPRCTDERPCVNCFSGQGECEVKQEADDLTQFLEQTDFDAAEKVASEKADAQPLPTAGEDDCDGCKI